MAKTVTHGLSLQAGSLYFIAGVALYTACMQHVPVTPSQVVAVASQQVFINPPAVEEEIMYAMYIHFVR